MKETIVEKLTNIVINKFGKEYAPLIEVSRVTKPHIDADFYSNIAMKLAKSLKQNPGNIAKDITEAIGFRWYFRISCKTRLYKFSN